MDLKKVPPEHHMGAVGYYNGIYAVRLKDGSVRGLRELDLRRETDPGLDDMTAVLRQTC